MEKIKKIVKTLEDSGALIKGIAETIENETKNKGVDSWYAIMYTLCKCSGN